MANPRLPNGLGSPQSIYQTSTTAWHKVGQKGFFDDGRVFYYARNSGAALAPGKLAMAEIIVANQTNLAVTATGIGETVVNVTPGATAWSANDFAEGYMCVNDVDSEGYTYKIASHAAITASTAFNLTLYDPLVVALTANSQVTLSKNPWQDPVIAAANQAHFAVGVPTCTIALGSTTKNYGWIQTWGVCAGWDDAATAIGAGITSGTTAGQIEINGTTDQPIGVQLFTGVATEYYPKFLTIAP
jgi:hypothetical protein